MDGKERAKRAIEFTGPDRIPQSTRDFFLLFHLPPQGWQPAEPYYPYVHPLIIKAGFWKSTRPLEPDWLEKKREALDEWGCVWIASGISSLGEIKHGALQDSWEGLEDLRIPDFSNWDRFQTFAQLGKSLGQGRYLLGVNENSLWERYRFLRGFDNALSDLILRPEEVHRLLERLTAAFLLVADQFHKAGADGFMLLDDWGTQRNSFISPRHFAEFFQPRYRQIVDRCHALNMHCGIHSCGNLRPLLPNFLASGFDFLQLDSPLLTGLDALADTLGGKSCFFNSPDIQTVYPRGDPAELTAHIQEMIRKLGNFNGGLVAWPYLEPQVIAVRPETVKLQEEVFTQSGNYPLNLAALCA